MRRFVWIVLLLLSLLTACGSGEDSQRTADARPSPEESTQPQGQKAPAGLQDAMNQLNQMAEGMNGGQKAIEPLNFRQLKEMMPEEATGLARTSHTGETSQAMGFSLSTAKGVYQADQQRIELTISDIGGVQMLLMSMAAWSSVQIDRETDTGYERTTEYDGHKAFEKYNRESQRGEITVLLGTRFIVQVEGRGVEMDALQETLSNLDLDELAELEQAAG